MSLSAVTVPAKSTKATAAIAHPKSSAKDIEAIDKDFFITTYLSSVERKEECLLPR